MTTLYLAYGANLNREEMSWRCPRARPVQAVQLMGWQLEFARHATIQRNPRGLLAAAVWELTEDCERSLDSFEGWPSYYRKETITVAGQPTMVYVMNRDEPATPSSGYLRCLAQGYQDWGLDLDLLWQAYDRAESQQVYQDPAGNSWQWPNSHLTDAVQDDNYYTS